MIDINHKEKSKMAFKELQDLSAEVTISIGGFNKKLRKDNPTEAEGYYLGFRQHPSTFTKGKMDSIYFFQTPKGNLGVWGKTDLDKKMAQVTPGVMTRIKFVGEVPSNKGNPMLKYSVATDEENTIPVTFAAPPSAASYDDDTISDDYAAAAPSPDEEDAAQAAALAALERKAKVSALLNKNRKA